MISQSDSASLDSGELLNLEIIAKLIADNLLVINNDRESMMLTIKLRCEPTALSKGQAQALQKYLEAILKEINAFKKENCLDDDWIDMVYDKEGNIRVLRITLPSLALYDTFIQQLANNLLPSSHQERQTKGENNNDKALSPTPLRCKGRRICKYT